VEEVVESLVEDGRRSDVAREWLIVSCRRSVKCFDRSRRIDARGAGVLYIKEVCESADEEVIDMNLHALVLEDPRCSDTLVLLAPILDTFLHKFPQSPSLEPIS